MGTVMGGRRPAAHPGFTLGRFGGARGIAGGGGRLSLFTPDPGISRRVVVIQGRVPPLVFRNSPESVDAVVIVAGKRDPGPSFPKRLLSPEQEAEVRKLICDKRPEQMKMPFALWTRAVWGRRESFSMISSVTNQGKCAAG